MNTIYTPIVTPTFALLIFVILLIVAFIIANFCNPATFKSTRGNIFLNVFFCLGVFFTFLFYYALVNLQASEYRSNVIQLTSKINQLLTNGVIEQLNIAVEKIPNFTMELFPLTKCGSIDTPDPDTPENTILKFKIAYKIFSLWQELLLSQKLIDMEQNAYLCIFLQKAHSKELQEIWQTTRLDFNCNTQTFGDLLFKYASNIKQQTPEHYIRAAKKLQCDKCYLKLIE